MDPSFQPENGKRTERQPILFHVSFFQLAQNIFIFIITNTAYTRPTPGESKAGVAHTQLAPTQVFCTNSNDLQRLHKLPMGIGRLEEEEVMLVKEVLEKEVVEEEEVVEDEEVL